MKSKMTVIIAGVMLFSQVSFADSFSLNTCIWTAKISNPFDSEGAAVDANSCHMNLPSNLESCLDTTREIRDSGDGILREVYEELNGNCLQRYPVADVKQQCQLKLKHAFATVYFDQTTDSNYKYKCSDAGEIEVCQYNVDSEKSDYDCSLE